MYWMLVLLLLGVVIVRVIINIDSKEEEHISDEAFRELFLNKYINSDDYTMVKIEGLPKSFKIGNVYFDKCVGNSKYFETFLSYVIIDGKVYDNGSLSIDQEWDFSYNTNNRDLLNYILDNLDKVEEINND